MSDLRTAAQQALEGLEKWQWDKDPRGADAYITALRAALAQQAEPVDTDCHTQGICQRSGYGITQQAEPVTSCGWLFRRNADGTIGIFAPPPKPGESQRTSDCVGPNNHDLHELLGKLADHMAALAQQAEPTPPDATAGLVDDLCLLHMGWKTDAEGDFYRAAWGRVIARAKQLKAQVGKGEEK